MTSDGQKRQVKYVDFPSQFGEEREALLQLVEQVFSRGDFIGGADIAAFEAEAAQFIGVKHVLAVNSGTDALIMGMAALGIGPGDEVITAPNSFVASAAAIAHLGAIPVFADTGDDFNLDPQAVRKAVTPRTKAIMPVHLTGRMARMDEIMVTAEAHGLAVIEDAAQAIGSRYNNRHSGTYGHIGCFSCHPLKNLNAAGDGGFIATDSDAVADHVRLVRNHGLQDRNTVVRWGMVSRMDTLQAAILRLRLKNLPSVVERRRRNASLYRKHLDPRVVGIPDEPANLFHTYHLFVIQVDRRDALKAHLAAAGIETAIHYPIPIHLQPAAASLGLARGAFPVAERQADRILSLPIHQFLSEDDVIAVAHAINGFFA
jgi:dTDP-4-amino-4,6-dideoxygalactose transaminase